MTASVFMQHACITAADVYFRAIRKLPMQSI